MRLFAYPAFLPRLCGLGALLFVEDCKRKLAGVEDLSKHLVKSTEDRPGRQLRVDYNVEASWEDAPDILLDITRAYQSLQIHSYLSHTAVLARGLIGTCVGPNPLQPSQSVQRPYTAFGSTITCLCNSSTGSCDYGRLMKHSWHWGFMPFGARAIDYLLY